MLSPKMHFTGGNMIYLINTFNPHWEGHALPECKNGVRSALDSPYMEQTRDQGRGRNAGYPAPPAQIRTRYGGRSYLVTL